MKYKNWIYFILLPFLFYFLVELYFGWPVDAVIPERKEGYVKSSMIVIAILVFSAAVGVSANYSNYKKLPHGKSKRQLHAIVSIALLLVTYVIAKFLIFGSSLNVQQFSEIVGIWPVNFKLLSKLLTGFLLIYFMVQVIFLLATKKWFRTQMLNRNMDVQVSDTRDV